MNEVKQLRVTLDKHICIDWVLCVDTRTDVLHQLDSLAAHGEAEAQAVLLYDHTSLHQTCSCKGQQLLYRFNIKKRT